MSKILRFLYICVILGCVIFVYHHFNLLYQKKDLEVKNTNLQIKDQLHISDLLQTINMNVAPVFYDENIVPNTNEIFLCISYPICTTCFIETCRYLDEYANTKRKKIVLLCRVNHISHVKKTIRFEGLGHIEVRELSMPQKGGSKMILVLGTNGNQFYLPLPEKREANFLKTFLPLSELSYPSSKTKK